MNPATVPSVLTFCFCLYKQEPLPRNQLAIAKRTQARRNGLEIVFRGHKPHQGPKKRELCISVSHGTLHITLHILIISQKNAHIHSKEALEAPNENFTSTTQNSRPCGAGGPDEAPGCGARRLWLSLSGTRCCAGIRMRTPRFPAIPAASQMVFIGPVGSSHSHARRSGRRCPISFTRHIACEHGVVVVVKAQG